MSYEMVLTTQPPSRQLAGRWGPKGLFILHGYEIQLAASPATWSWSPLLPASFVLLLHLVGCLGHG